MSAHPEAMETIGNYAIERSLAEGSMGHVYVARHTLTHARVALKVLRTDLRADAQAEERFLREVRAAAHIGHDGIVKVHDAGRSDQGVLYLAMELLSGETLEERMVQLQGERLPLLDLLLHALPPLAAAHSHGIVHRDLKPANVFIACAADGSEQVKLLDFGLARDTREKSGTETGIALGTPYYMSPEQATRPRLVGPASDVWSMGVMMYEVLSGHMPFEGETLHAVVIHSSTSPHVPLIEHEPHLDARLCALVEECLRKEPGDRPADATQLLDRLGPLLADETLRAALAARSARPERDSMALPLTRSDMPFADTAISLMPRLIDSEVRQVTRRRSRGLWMTAVTLVALATAGFLWAVQRSDAPTRTAKPEASKTLSQPTAAPEAALKQPFQPVRQQPVAQPARAKVASAQREPAARDKTPAVSSPKPASAITTPPTAAAMSAAPVTQPASQAAASPPTAADAPSQPPTAASPDPSNEPAPAEAATAQHPAPEPPAASTPEPPLPIPDDLPPPEPAEPSPDTPP